MPLKIAEQEQRQKDYSFTDFSNQLLSLLQCASPLSMCINLPRPTSSP